MATVLMYLILSAIFLTIGFGLGINRRLNAGNILLISLVILLPITKPLVQCSLPIVLICHFGLMAAFQLGFVVSLVLESAEDRKQKILAPKRAKDGGG